MTEPLATAKANAVSPAARQPTALPAAVDSLSGPGGAVDSARSPPQARELSPVAETFVPFQSHQTTVKLEGRHVELEGASQGAGSEPWGQKASTSGGGGQQQAAGLDLTCTEELDFSDVQVCAYSQPQNRKPETPNPNPRPHTPNPKLPLYVPCGPTVLVRSSFASFPRK